MKFRNFVLAGVGLLGLALTSFAQITTIEGDVKGADGKPIPNAMVRIERIDIKGAYPVKTDKKGHYYHTGLPIGTYNVSVEVDGKEADKVSNVRTSPGDSKVVDFDLGKANAQSGQLSKDAERGMTSEQKGAAEKQMKEREGQLKARAALNESFNAGLNAIQAKQWDAAVENLTKASTVDPTQAAVWAQLGEAYTGLASTKTGADFDAATAKGLEAYAKAIELKPDDAAAHNNYALALARAKKIPEMQVELQKAVDLDPPNAGKYYYNLGAVLVNNGQNDAAGDAFKKAIATNSNYADAWYQYGVTLVAKAQIAPDGKITPPAGTAEAFQKYLELAPTGQFADAAKEMLTTLGTSVSTGFSNTKKKK